MPSSTGCSILSLAAVVGWIITATVPAACFGFIGSRKEEISFLFSSFTRPSNHLRYSWDAGVVDGAIHLTADDIYQPPVEYGQGSAGHVSLWAGPPYIDSRTAEDLLSYGASFNTSFTMRLSWSQQRNNDDGGLLLQVMSRVRDRLDRTVYYPPLARTTTGSNISIQIGSLKYYYEETSRGVYVSITPASMANHTVWVDYDAVGHNLSVYIVEGAWKPKPDQATLHATLDIDGVLGKGYFYKHFGLFASKKRSLPSCHPVIYSWNVTVDSWKIRRDRRIGLLVAISLSSVLVAAGAAIIFVALRWSTLAAWYRALVMKLELSRALRRLPGMPREFKFADVQKATRNFHDSNRLGRGGFGAVYKGTILTTASTDGGQEGRRGRGYIEIAVKKFTRKEDHGYDDFLAEVAIIHRLRHKNIVPLLGSFRSSPLFNFLDTNVNLGYVLI